MIKIAKKVTAQLIPLVRVQLVKGVKLLPQQCTRVQVGSNGVVRNATVSMKEPDSVVTDLMLKIKLCLTEFRNGTGHLMISKLTEFTQKLEREWGVRTLQDAEEVFPPPIEVNTKALAQSAVKMVTTDSDRRSKVCDFFKHNIQLLGPEKEEFCKMLIMKYLV